VKTIRDIFAPMGGVDLQIPPRGPTRDAGMKWRGQYGYRRCQSPARLIDHQDWFESSFRL
jgi:hypothetical protein